MAAYGKSFRFLLGAAGVLSFAAYAAAVVEPSALVGVVAQRYPWNGTVDVTCKVADAPKGARLVVWANGVEVVRLAATNGEQKVSFDASKVDALKNKLLKDVKVAARVEVPGHD